MGDSAVASGGEDGGGFGLRGAAAGRALSDTTQGGIIAGVDVLALRLDQFLVQAVIILAMTRCSLRLSPPSNL